MTKSVSLIIALSFVFLFGNAQTYHVHVNTNMGNMEFMLYDDTPLHRDAFVELALEGHFDGTLFYRVIENYIIQGGSRDSRNAPPGKFIGYGDPTKTVNDEILDHRFCKKGALCAPRQPDEINIFKQSDISQFFIVQGEVYSPGLLDTMEIAVNRPIRQKITREVYKPALRERLNALKEEKLMSEARILADSIMEEIEVRYTLAPGKLIFTPEQRKAYSSIGGSPQLDNEYTVFGEIIKGMEVIDRIASLKTDENNRPLTDVKIEIKVLYQ
jgi:peptidyl-prolyl cis-trans isomerase B (cyclophilin B)